MTSSLQRALSILEKVAWALFLLCLPVTSFPFFPRVLGGSALVRPLSLFPLLVLLVLATLPRLLTRPAPKTLRSLLPFVLIAIGVSALSLLSGIEPTFGVTVGNRIVRAIITLAIGGAIYFTVSLMPRSVEDLRASLRWLYAGFSIAMLWGSFQAIYIVHFVPSYYRFLTGIQEYISTRKLFTTRVSGMTYEPNWFAEQISALLLPWLLASVLSGYSVFRWRWRWLTLEWLLLLWAVIVLAFTFSRAGLANLILVSFLALLFFRQPRSGAHPARRWTRRLVEAGVAVVILVGMIYLAGSKNTFFARLWDYWSTEKQVSVSDYFEYLGFGARFTYSEAAYKTYQEHPLLGVGLGNFAFYFSDTLPDRPLAPTPELLRLVLPDDGRDRLITPKNFYIRILAETGLLGAAAFFAFLAAVVGCALFLWFSPAKDSKYWGSAGLLGLIAFAASALSFDSFAIPNMWVVFGLITAAAWVYTQPQNREATR